MKNKKLVGLGAFLAVGLAAVSAFAWPPNDEAMWMVRYDADLDVQVNEFIGPVASGDYGFACQNGTSGEYELCTLGDSIVNTGGVLDVVSAAPSQSSASGRSLNSCFQVSSTKNALVNYSVEIASTLSLTGGQSGTAYLEIYSDSGCTTGTQEIGRVTNGNTGTLTIGLNTTQTQGAQLSGYVPAGKYVRLRTANNTGTPTFTYRSGQETQL